MGELAILSDEQAKAVQEGFKFGSQSLETARDFGGYVARILGTAPEDLVGLLGGDWLRIKRAENISRMARETFKQLKDAGVQEPEPVSLSVGLPLLQAAADENRDELVDLWSRLLAATMDPTRTRHVRQVFIDIVGKLDPIDALVFAALSEPAGRLQPSPAVFLASQLGVGQDDIRVSLQHIMELGCIRDSHVRLGEIVAEFELPVLTPLGRELRRILKV